MAEAMHKIPVNIEEEMKRSYLDYAMSVIIGRALPDARDGLKPVHRRILYSMEDLGLRPNKPFKKSATIVGECFVAGTRVLTEKGLVPIETIERGDWVYTQESLAPVTELFEMPERELIKITLETGLAVTVTPAQPLKVINRFMQYEWKQADEITPEDHLVVRASYPDRLSYIRLPDWQGRKIMLDEDLAYFIGQFLSDGWFERHHGRFCFYSTSRSVIERIRTILISTFGYEANVETVRRDTLYKDGTSRENTAYQVRVHSSAINNYLSSVLGITAESKAHTKRIPEQFFRSPRSVPASLISGMIDGDGSIHINRAMIHYGTVSEGLADDLQLLLQHLGIFATRFVKRVEQTREHIINGRPIHARFPFHSLEVQGRYAKELARMLRLEHEAKSQRLAPIAEASLKTSKYDRVPRASAIVFGELSRRHLGGGWYQDAQGQKFRMGIKYPTGSKIRYSSDLLALPLNRAQLASWGISDKLARMGSHLAPFVCNLLENDIHFIRVARVEAAPAQKTYDLEVAGIHEFVANGIVSHNCLGKYHPHGDSAVYDALVRMAQDFSMRNPLIEGQGNFGCFAGDTKIKLLDGTERTFAELSELPKNEIFYVYSVADDGRIVVGEGRHSRITRRKAQLVELTFDDGSKARCTPDHRFMLRDGSWKEAQHLSIEDSLMAGYFDIVPMYYATIHKTSNYSSVVASIETAEEVQQTADHELQTTNHRVVEIRWLDEPADVYDITVNEYHNFMLANGCIVHNSVDGDSAAAYRYTEARLTRIATEMLADIDKDTVDFVPNYDESRMEPVVLPTRFPNLLVNGSSGIAVGMATNIPPHNLSEVIEATIHLIQNPAATLKTLMAKLPGPDFPTGGFIYGREGINQAYKTGRGSIVMRARATIDRAGRAGERMAILVTEIPFQVNKAKLIERIADLINDKKLEGISDLRDESDREGMRIMIELKRDAIPDIVLNNLYKMTPMQQSFGVINLAIVNGQPRELPLTDTLNLFIEHRREVVIRRSRFDLKKAEARAHILEGLKKALDNLDAVIAVIRKSKATQEARDALMSRFKFTEAQARAILEMQLQRLTGLERQRLIDEYKDIIQRIAELQEILSNESVLRGVIVKELREVQRAYGDPRRTEIIEAGAELTLEDLIADEDMAITVTHSGYIKRTPVSVYRAQRRGGTGRRGAALKTEDVVDHLFVASTHSYIMIFTNNGQVYKLKVHEIPDAGAAGKGKAIVNLLNMPKDEKVAGIIPVRAFEEGKYVVLATRKGTIKKTELSDFANIRPRGINAMGINKGDELIAVELTDGEQKIFLATNLGMAICFEESDVRSMGRPAYGVRGISLKKGDYVISVAAVSGDVEMLSISENGFGKRTKLDAYRVQSRGGRGVINMKTSERNGKVVAVLPVNDESQVLIITTQGKLIRVRAKGIRESGRSTQGVKLIDTSDGDFVSSASLIEREQDATEAAASQQ